MCSSDEQSCQIEKSRLIYSIVKSHTSFKEESSSRYSAHVSPQILGEASISGLLQAVSRFLKKLNTNEEAQCDLKGCECSLQQESSNGRKADPPGAARNLQNSLTVRNKLGLMYFIHLRTLNNFLLRVSLISS